MAAFSVGGREIFLYSECQGDIETETYCAHMLAGHGIVTNLDTALGLDDGVCKLLVWLTLLRSGFWKSVMLLHDNLIPHTTRETFLRVFAFSTSSTW